MLESIPLNITGAEKDYEFTTSWILPVLRENINKTRLAFFTEYFLPLAASCLRRSKEAKAVGDNIGYKTYEVLVYQIWLLSDLCKCDTASSKKFLASSLPQLPG